MQAASLNNLTQSLFHILLSGAPQGSILDPNFLYIFINDLLLFIKYVDYTNFADVGTIHAGRNSIEELVKVLRKERLTH